MKSLIATSILFGFLVLTSDKAVADTYQIFTLITDNGYNFYGMDSGGTVTITHPTIGCGTANCIDYFTFSDGVLTSLSFTSPMFIPDNGNPCIPVVPVGGSVFRGVCNNGREAILGNMPGDPMPFHPRLYENSGSGFDLLSIIGNGSFIFMDGKGDIVWNDATFENWYEAVDLTTASTPEPSTILLVGSGIFFALARARRNFQVH